MQALGTVYHHARDVLDRINPDRWNRQQQQQLQAATADAEGVVISGGAGGGRDMDDMVHGQNRQTGRRRRRRRQTVDRTPAIDNDDFRLLIFRILILVISIRVSQREPQGS